MRRLTYALLLLLLVGATPAEARHRHSHAEGDADAGQFDYYILSLSWAPTYCFTHSDDSSECSGKGYGFVVHGLWPQYAGGGYPENCSSQYDLTAQAQAKGRTLYPSERLMQHEWREHGTCSGLDALSYFQIVDRATAAVKVPVVLETPRAAQSLTASQIEDLFHAANPQSPGNALVVTCSRGELSEVRICLTKELSVHACGRDVRTMCPGGPVSIPAAHKLRAATD